MAILTLSGTEGPEIGVEGRGWSRVWASMEGGGHFTVQGDPGEVERPAGGTLGAAADAGHL